MAYKESDLVSGIKSHDRFLYQELINMYTNDIYNLVNNVLIYKNMKKKVEYITIEVFKYVWTDLKKYDKNNSTLRTWLYIVAKEKIAELSSQLKEEEELDQSPKQLIHIINNFEDREAELIIRKYYFYQSNRSLSKYFEVTTKEIEEQLAECRKEIIQVLEMENNDKLLFKLFDKLSYGLVEEILDRLDIDFDETVEEKFIGKVKDSAFAELNIKKPKKYQKRDDYKWILFALCILGIWLMYRFKDEMLEDMNKKEVQEIPIETMETIKSNAGLEGKDISKVVIIHSETKKKTVITKENLIQETVDQLNNIVVSDMQQANSKHYDYNMIIYDDADMPIITFTNNAVVMNEKTFYLKSDVDYTSILENTKGK